MNIPPIEDCYWEVPQKCPRCGSNAVREYDESILTSHYVGPKRKHASSNDPFPDFVYVKCNKTIGCWGAFVPAENDIESETVKMLIKDKLQHLGLLKRIANWHGWSLVQDRHSAYAARRQGLRLIYE